MLKILTLTLVISSFAASRSANQATSTQQSPEKIEAEIKKMFDENRSRSEFTTQEGLKAYTFLPASDEALAAVDHFGKNAIAVIATYLNSTSRRDQALALRLLGQIGGSEIVQPLSDYLRRADSPFSRQMAMRWLVAAVPSGEIGEILEERASSDPDPGVRALAVKLKEEVGRKLIQAQQPIRAK